MRSQPCKNNGRIKKIGRIKRTGKLQARLSVPVPEAAFVPDASAWPQRQLVSVAKALNLCFGQKGPGRD